MDDVVFASATALACAILRRRLPVETVVRAHLARIEAVNPALNALVQSAADTALDEAHEADDALTRGEIWGPLHGVPFTVKDNIETVGLVCACGTLGLANNVPTREAIVVSRLRAAGGIVLGKTNLPEAGLGYETDNYVYGRTSNPYDLARVSGGSSGGEAALIAAGGSPLGLATDGGGSARWPAHCCGIAGIKPTTGRTPKLGHVPPPGGALNGIWQMSLLARHVEDLTLALPLICGPDHRDPTTVPVPLGAPEAVNLSELRVVVYTDDGISTPSAEIVAAVEQSAELLARAGATVVRKRPVGIEKTHDIFYRLQAADGGTGLKAILRSWGTEQAHPSTLRALQAMSGRRISSAALGSALFELDGFRREMATFMADYDVILCPVATRAAVPHGVTYEVASPPGFPEMFSYLMTFNLTGWPCGAVRVGTSGEGLPLGVQVAAGPWREDIVLAVLHHLEISGGGWRRPPI
jgi:amidase